MPRAEGERFELVVRALPGGGPVAQRLRMALKTLLRAYRLRCERAVELPPAGAPKWGGKADEEVDQQREGPR